MDGICMFFFIRHSDGSHRKAGGSESPVIGSTNRDAAGDYTYSVSAPSACWITALPELKLRA